MAIPFLGAIVGGIIDLVTSQASSWAARKKLKAEAAVEIEKRKVELIKSKVDAEIDWDKIMATGSQSSWKDEYWTIVLSVPLIAVFIPPLLPYIAAGFQALDENVPDWYKIALGVAIGAAFGYRKITEYMMGKRNG